MQEMHSIGSELFSGGGDDRRSRPEDHQALKCPRCDSLNTKFCYYNNYNLSQPRHFCKGCRRYWTKGGVLRNVPVGGGCRKTSKRSKPKQTKSTAAAATATATTLPNTKPPSAPPQQEEERQIERKSPTSHSSSESSSLTAANTTTGGNNTIEVGSNESKPFKNSKINLNFEGDSLEQGSAGGIFSEIGSFSSLTNSTNDQLGFGFRGLEQIQQDQNRQWQQLLQTVDKEEMKLPMTGGFIDQTVDVELSGFQSSRSRNGGGFGTLDWGGTAGGFDLPNTVDHNYWNQSQWTDLDQNTLYLP